MNKVGPLSPEALGLFPVFLESSDPPAEAPGLFNKRAGTENSRPRRAAVPAVAGNFAPIDSWEVDGVVRNANGTALCLQMILNR